MRRAMQTIVEPPHGNALQACVATVLAKPLDDVPNFVTSTDYWAAMLEHANTLGLSLLKVPLDGGRLPFPSLPGTLCIARGTSPRGDHGHVVVATVAPDGVSLEYVHDPFSGGGYLSGDASWAAFYVAREPALLPPPSAPSHAALAQELEDAGFDVLAPLRVSWYNELLRKLGLATDSTDYLTSAGEEHASGAPAFKLAPLPDYGRDGNALAFLVGNSRAMWPRFLEWLSARPDASIAHPVDAYTAEVIGGAAARFAASAGARAHQVFWAYEMAPERLVDMNRAAMVAGVTHFSDEMFLSVHPTYGAWVAFRAVVVLDLPATHLHAPPPPQPVLLTDAEADAAKAAFADALKASSEVELSVDGMPLHLAHKWAAMRDCVGRGREHKYTDLQSEYHYTKDPALIVKALAERGTEAHASRCVDEPR